MSRMLLTMNTVSLYLFHAPKEVTSVHDPVAVTSHNAVLLFERGAVMQAMITLAQYNALLLQLGNPVWRSHHVAVLV